MEESVEYGRSRKRDNDGGDRCYRGDSDDHGQRTMDDGRNTMDDGQWAILDLCRCGDTPFNSLLGACTADLAKMGGGVAPIGVGHYGTEFRAAAMLVRAVISGALGVRSGYGLRATGYRGEDIRVLSVGDGDTECADSGSGSAWRLGYHCFRDDECRFCRSVAMGDQYAAALCRLAIFEKKPTFYTSINKIFNKILYVWKIFCNFVPKLS